MYLIKCKRYARERSVGVEIVRALHGVTVTEGANKGIIATTGRFSMTARKYLDSLATKWLLEGREFDGIMEWLRIYQTAPMEGQLRGMRER
jgi:restriction system protein